MLSNLTQHLFKLQKKKKEMNEQQQTNEKI